MYKCMFSIWKLLAKCAYVCLWWPYQWFAQCNWYALKCCVCSLGCVLDHSRVTKLRACGLNRWEGFFFFFWSFHLCSVLILLDLSKASSHTIVNSENVVCVHVYTSVTLQVWRWCDLGQWTCQPAHDMHYKKGTFFFFTQTFIDRKSHAFWFLRTFTLKSIVDTVVRSNVLCLRCINCLLLYFTVFVFGCGCVYTVGSGIYHWVIFTRAFFS